MTTFRLKIEADMRSIPLLHRFIERGGRELAMEPADVHDLRLAAEEIVSNTITHGYGSSGGAITVQLSKEEGAGIVEVWDDAKVFDPSCHSPSADDRPLSERPPGGMGLLLLRQAVDEVGHEAPAAGGNHVTLKKHLAPTVSSQDRPLEGPDPTS